MANGNDIIDFTDNLVSEIDIADNLTTDDSTKALSAKQGVILLDLINSIKQILTSDDVNLDELQEIVNYIKQNREDLEHLSVNNIAGLQEILDLKSDIDHNHNLADLSEKSYNSLTDTPDLDAIADTKKVKINDNDTEGYLEDKIEVTSPLTVEQNGSVLNTKLNYNEDIFELTDNKLSINQSLLNHSNEAYFIVKYTPNEEDWYLGSVNRNESTAVYNYLAIFDVNKGAYEVSNYGSLDVANEQHQYGTLKDETDITTLRFKFPTAGRYRFDIAVTGQIDQTFTDDWFGIGLVRCNDDSEYETGGVLSTYGKLLTSYRYYKENAVSGKVIFNYTYTWSLDITEDDANDWWTLGLQSVDNLWSRKIAYSFMLLDK